tara:strand:+ start:79 stop:1008 length:930 start_codon:yes stop_codon:yes gene_type:complete
MKILIVGLGNQGKKRIKYLNKYQVFGSYDPYSKSATFNKISKIPLDKFDTVFICTPDQKKYELAKFFIQNYKNVLVEKPFLMDLKKANYLYSLAKKNKTLLYSAYNHRFEPNIIKIKKDVNNYKSKVYYIKLFYGNGTAADVYKSTWKNIGLGVISDLTPHLLDTLIFVHGYKKISKIKIHTLSKFENKSFDHFIISFNYGDIFIELEVSYCSWKNNFRYEIYSKKHSFHIESLDKWGHSSYKRFFRKFPSGNPQKYMINKNNTSDRTWKLEHSFFSKNINNLKINIQSYKRDKFIINFLNKIKKLINN